MGQTTTGSFPHSPPQNLPLIRASELAQFDFCRRAWWLGAVKNLPAESQEALRRGRTRHARHGRQVRLASLWRRAGLALMIVGCLLLATALAWLWLF